MQIQPGTDNARLSAEIGRKAQRKARHFSSVPNPEGMEDLEISLADDGGSLVMVVRHGGKVYKSTLTEA